MPALLSQSEIEDVTADFSIYSRYIFEATRGMPFMWNHHHKTLCDAMERVFIGLSTRLIITIPPRFSKTESAVINFAAWAMGHFPDSEFIHVSYSATLAANNSYRIRGIMQHEAYRELFPDVTLAQDSKARNWWRTEQGGAFYATGTDGTITGFGAGKVGTERFAGAVILDDLHKAKEAKRSAAARQNAKDFFQTTIESRLNSKNTPIVIIGQRLHEDDIPGWLLNGGNGEEWELINLPAIQSDGSALWPDKMDLPELRRLKKTKPYEFASQYMQTPVPLGGGMFKRAWMNQRYRRMPAGIVSIVQSWDCGQKDKIDRNDPSVCTTWGITANGYYLLDRYKGTTEYPDLKRDCLDCAAKWKPNEILIEDKANGIPLIQDLRRETRLPVIAIEPVGNKVDRADECTAEFEAGNVWLPESTDWVADYISELTTFPASTHDDQVDSTSQFLNRQRGGGVASYATAGSRRY